MNPVTIPALHTLSKQELFDMSARHILSTGKPSLEKLSVDSALYRCVYSGSGCAAAPFIREEERMWVNPIGAWAALVQRGKVDANVSYGANEFISQLQKCHDRNAFGKEQGGASASFLINWEQDMRLLGLEHGLSLEVLDAAPAKA